MAEDGQAAGAPTIYDVARVAGVAPSTVSRALARPGRVSASTAARIRAVSEDLGYRTRPIAGAPVGDRTRIIALLVSDIANPFYAEIIRGAERAAALEGYALLLADAQESGMIEREILERILPTCEGLVIGSSRMPDSALRMIAKQRPTVVVNRALGDLPSIVRDNPRGVAMALEHLAGLDHEQVTYVAGPEASWADGVRWRCVRDSAPAWGMSTRRIGPYAPTFEGGRAATREYLAHPTSAVIAYNDLMAIGLITGLQDAGLRVPEDASVVGFDDILPARLVRPPLTTVAAPLGYMGQTAVRNLVALINGAQHRNPSALVLPVQFVVRGSTGRRRSLRVFPDPRKVPAGASRATREAAHRAALASVASLGGVAN